MRLDPRHFHALLLRASLIERLQGERAAAPIYGAAILQAPVEDRLDPATRRALARAREINQRYGAELNAVLRACFEDIPLSAGGAHNAQMFVDLLTGRRRNYRQEPLGYFYPGLPAVEFWPRERFDWIEALEASASAIAGEMQVVGFKDPNLRPYMDLPELEPLDQWAELNRSPRWTAFHLYQHGRRIEANCARCPATIAAMAAIGSADRGEPLALGHVLGAAAAYAHSSPYRSRQHPPRRPSGAGRAGRLLLSGRRRDAGLAGRGGLGVR